MKLSINTNNAEALLDAIKKATSSISKEEMYHKESTSRLNEIHQRLYGKSPYILWQYKDNDFYLKGEEDLRLQADTSENEKLRFTFLNDVDASDSDLKSYLQVITYFLLNADNKEIEDIEVKSFCIEFIDEE